MFSIYVRNRWSTKKNPATTYVDFIIVGAPTGSGYGVNRWHGWVDVDTREIVQEG
jgi:hypothetical protein